MWKGDKSYMTRNLVFFDGWKGRKFFFQDPSPRIDGRISGEGEGSWGREHVCAAERNILWRRVTVLKDRRFREGEMGPLCR